MIEVSKGFVLIMIENMECKDFRIRLIRKELLLNIYYYIY